MRVDLPIVGGAYEHRVLPVSAQTLKNWYVESNPTKDVFTLQTFPGSKSFSTGTGADRGMTVFQGLLYKVSGSTLYRIDSAGTQTTIGAVNGAARCTFATDANSLIIATSGNVYEYDGTLTAASVDESPDYVTYLNNQAIYDGTGNRFSVSDPGLLTTVDPLNYASAESDGDLLIRPYVYNQNLYLFGEKTIETWYNSGAGNPPFDRIQGGIMQIGTASGDSISNNDSFVYFLGDDRKVHQLLAAQTRPVSTPVLVEEFETYTVDDAIGFCATINGHPFYFLTFPTSEKTWIFNETTGTWSQMTSGVDEGAHVATSYIYHYGKHLIANEGNVLEWDSKTYTDNGLPIIRERCTQNLAAQLLAPNLSGIGVEWNSIDFTISSTATATGQGEDPVLMLSYSDDGGYTFSNERHMKLGRSGQYLWKTQASQLGYSVERVYKMRISDPVNCTIQRASAEIEISYG